MGSQKVWALAGVAALLVSNTAIAADLLPPPPVIEPPPVHEPIGSGWYLRGDVGVGIYQEPELELANIGTPYDFAFVQEDLGATGLLGIGVGYRLNSWFRFDVTGEYRFGATLNGVDRVSYNVSPGVDIRQSNAYSGETSSFVGLVNAYIDLGTWWCLTPFVGVGLGFANNYLDSLVDHSSQYTFDLATGNITGFWGAPTGYFQDGSRTNFAWALHAGVGYEVNPNLTLELAYRYINLGKFESGQLFGPISGQPQNNRLAAKEVDAHDVKIAMRWTFGDPNCCSTPPEPVEPIVRKY